MDNAEQLAWILEVSGIKREEFETWFKTHIEAFMLLSALWRSLKDLQANHRYYLG